MKRFLLAAALILSLTAFSSFASAQVPVPAISINKRVDRLDKQIASIIFFVLYNAQGEEVATRDVTANPEAVKIPLGYRSDINVFFNNIVVEHMKYSTFPMSGALADVRSSRQSVRGAQNKDRQVFDLKFNELDVYNLGNKQALFAGELDLRNARVGANALLLRAETKHAEHLDAMIFSNTTWKRNYLNDGIAVVYLPAPKSDAEKGAMLVDLKRNGWVFNDPNVDRQLTAIAYGGGQVVANNQATSDEQYDRSQDGQRDERKLDADPVKCRVGDDVIDGTTYEYRLGDVLTIEQPGEFEVEIVRTDDNESIFRKRYTNQAELRLKSLRTDTTYRIEVWARGQLARTITLRQGGRS